MRESRYRESRVCRVLGNPVVYATVQLLAERGPMAPSAIAKAVRRHLATTSNHLGTLRTADLVRYDRKGGHTRYWLKHPDETKRVLVALSALVQSSGRVPD